jgi:hypothetical protein
LTPSARFVEIARVSWVIRYEVELDAPFKAERLGELVGYGFPLSEFSSGFSLRPVDGTKLLRGSTTPSGDWRTVDDVIKVLATLLKAEVDFGGQSFVLDLFGQGERLPVAQLDLEDVQRKLIVLWGSLDLGLEPEDEEDDARPPVPPGQERTPSTKVELLLARARADFELWKRSQGEG